MSEKFLDKAYDLDTEKGTQEFYDQWSSSYDQEVGEAGYVTPTRIASALVKYSDPTQPVLDFGCGTGLSGLALKHQGFEIIDGMDVSEEMMKSAEKRGLYRSLDVIDPTADLKIPQGTYKSIVACGVIGAGAAPLSVLDALMNLLSRGDKLAFSFNDHTLLDKSYESRVNEYLDCGTFRLLFREHGPHLTGLEMKSTVYVVEKT